MSEVKEDSQSKGMAEEANQGTADLNEGENTSNAIPSDDNMANEKRQQPHKVIPDAALSSESANPDARNDLVKINQDFENTGLAEKKTLSQEEPSPDEDSMKNMDDKNYLSQAVVKNHDESEKESVTNKKQPIIEANSDDDHTGEQKASETTPSPVLDEQKHNESKEFLSTNAESKDGGELREAQGQHVNSTEKGSNQPGFSNQEPSCEDHIRKQKAQETTTLLLPNDKQEGQATLNEKSTATHTKSEDGEDHIRKQNAPETTTSPIPNDKQEGQAMLNEESTTTNDTNTESEDDVKNNSASVEPQDRQRSTALAQDMPVKKKLHGQVNDDEIIDHSDQEITGHTVTEIHGGNRRYLIAVGIVVIVAILVQYLRQPESLPQENDVRQIDIFLRQLEKLKTQFPNQRVELWHRSRIHLQRHLQTAQPTEPVSLILTAGLSAEKTLHCLAQGLASAFSSALNASVLHIDGASKADQDSDQVKLDIDRKLQGAFEGDKPVAIIHRFEELPPGSTLIFYRYCDHENAAYKKTFLIFTVLLGEEEEIPSKISLSSVEEMVDDHLQKKFLSHGHPVSFDMMDLDKYGGLWSRISHLILPVAAEKRIELEGC